MTNMRQYLAWIQQNQKNNPEWRDATVWQNRNQTKVNETKKPAPEDVEVVEEKPEE